MLTVRGSGPCVTVRLSRLTRSPVARHSATASATIVRSQGSGRPSKGRDSACSAEIPNWLQATLFHSMTRPLWSTPMRKAESESSTERLSRAAEVRRACACWRSAACACSEAFASRSERTCASIVALAWLRLAARAARRGQLDLEGAPRALAEDRVEQRRDAVAEGEHARQPTRRDDGHED